MPLFGRGTTTCLTTGRGAGKDVSPILGVRGVAHAVRAGFRHREGAGARRPVGEALRRARLFHRLGLLGGADRSEIHAQVGQELRVRHGQAEDDALVAVLGDAGDQVGYADGGEIGVAGIRDAVEGVARHHQPGEAEQHVLGGEDARRREARNRVEGDARAELEDILAAVVGNRPAGGEAGNDAAAAPVVFDQPVEYVAAGDAVRVGGGGEGRRYRIDPLRDAARGFVGDRGGGRRRRGLVRELSGDQSQDAHPGEDDSPPAVSPEVHDPSLFCQGFLMPRGRGPIKRRGRGRAVLRGRAAAAPPGRGRAGGGRFRRSGEGRGRPRRAARRREGSPPPRPGGAPARP